MSNQILTETKVNTAENSSAASMQPKDAPSACRMQGKSWLKGGLAMAMCCAVPLLILGAVALFGISQSALASGFLSLATALACPVGMFLMMRMMMKDKK